MYINLYHRDNTIVAFTLSEDEATHRRAWIQKDNPKSISGLSLTVCEHDNSEAYQDLINYLLEDDGFEEVDPKYFETIGFWEDNDK